MLETVCKLKMLKMPILFHSFSGDYHNYLWIWNEKKCLKTAMALKNIFLHFWKTRNYSEEDKAPSLCLQ